MLLFLFGVAAGFVSALALVRLLIVLEDRRARREMAEWNSIYQSRG